MALIKLGGNINEQIETEISKKNIEDMNLSELQKEMKRIAFSNPSIFAEENPSNYQTIIDQNRYKAIVEKGSEQAINFEIADSILRNQYNKPKFMNIDQNIYGKMKTIAQENPKIFLETNYDKKTEKAKKKFDKLLTKGLKSSEQFQKAAEYLKNQYKPQETIMIIRPGFTLI